jgi:hypothetical protein
MTRGSIAALLGPIASAGPRRAPPQEYHSFPRLPGARGGGGYGHRLCRYLGRRSPRRCLMPGRCGCAGPVVEHVPAPTNGRRAFVQQQVLRGLNAARK